MTEKKGGKIRSHIAIKEVEGINKSMQEEA